MYGGARLASLSVQVFSELSQYQSLRFLDPLGSLLDACAVDEATAAAASPAFMSGAVLLPLMDILMCQVCVQMGASPLRMCCMRACCSTATP